jgi:hypothetical protein
MAFVFVQMIHLNLGMANVSGSRLLVNTDFKQ